MSLYADDTDSSNEHTAKNDIQVLSRSSKRSRNCVLKCKIKMDAEKSQAVMFKKRIHPKTNIHQASGHGSVQDKTSQIKDELLNRKKKLALLKTKIRLIQAVIPPMLMYTFAALGIHARPTGRRYRLNKIAAYVRT